MNTRLVLIAVAMLCAGLVQAEPPADKGQGKPQAQGPSQDTPGQTTSDCNHRANSRDLKGQERKQFVEWCEERGGAYHYDDRRWQAERSCYQKADDKGLAGDKRRTFLKNCFANHPQPQDTDDRPKYTK